MKEKILLDTDIGSDIDDAVCLAYLLMQPRCELLGVTTVSGQSRERAEMVSVLCAAAGRRVPILPGIEAPLFVEQRQPEAQQAKKLGRWAHARDFPAMNAIAFLAAQILANPGEVTLLTIGPLTNIALLFKTYPQTVSALKQLVMMCGVFTEDPSNPWKEEWNALLDPQAAQIVYESPVRIHKSIGLDVTRQVDMPVDEVMEKFTHPILSPVLDFAEVWFAEQDRMIFHDPLAAVTIFDPQVCGFSKGVVAMNSLAGSDQPAATIFQESAESARHQVALSVDRDRFFNDYFSVFD